VSTYSRAPRHLILSRGLHGLFGSGEITTGGYTLDVGGAPCARLPIIITDANAICGRRLVLGANDAALASQLVMALLVAGENVSTAVEAPRFHILADGSMGIEGAHSPAFDEDVLKYLETLTASPVLEAEPYASSNVVGEGQGRPQLALGQQRWRDCKQVLVVQLDCLFHDVIIQNGVE
jgi:hypothetical protein